MLSHNTLGITSGGIQQALCLLINRTEIKFGVYIISVPDDLFLQTNKQTNKEYCTYLPHNMAVHPPRRMDCFQTACHNKHTRSILGGSACQLHSSNPAEIICNTV